MKRFYLFIFTLLCIKNVQAQLLAFPTAEGAGKFVTGGRGTVATAPTVYEVTNLTDVNTAGSFRYACTNNSPAAANRIIVFRVSGTIHLTSALTLTRANTTIAGQTAPGDGICIADYPVYLGANNIIVRYLRFRLGDKNQLVTTPANCGIPVTPFSANPSCVPTANASGADDAFGDNGAGRTNIIIDHCSMSWSDDEAFTVYKGNNVTLQWNILSEPLNFSYHVETSDVNYEQHAYGGIWGGTYTTAHHNLLAHCKGRMPRFDGTRNIAAELVDFRNNVIYDWGDYNTNGGEGGTYNVVNNYYKYGPSTPSTVTSGVNRRNMIINPYKQASPAIPYGQYYLTGNYCDNSTDVSNYNWKGAAMNGGTPTDTTGSKVLVPFAVTYPINMETTQDAYNAVLLKAGCSLPNRDTLDARIVNDVVNRAGALIDCQGGYPHATPYSTSQTAWPTLASGTSQTDTDHDGMPDNWENARGLNPSNAADRNTYQTTTGYNNLENYLNGDTITAAGTLNTCVQARGVTCISSGQWLHAKDTTYSYYLSPNYTAATDTNHIVASILDDGNYGDFTVSYYTTNTNRTDIAGWQYARRNITITPSNPALITQPVTVRLYISQSEFNVLKAADATISTIADLKIVKAPLNSCVTSLTGSYSGIPQTSSAVFGTYQNGYYVEFQTSSFSTFFFESKSSPIPVKLSSFDVKKQNNTTAVIKWTTEQETNSRDFYVQRSNDAAAWTTIATIAAAGNSSVQKTYSFTDAGTKSGVYYYRLIQNDLDGKSSVSETRKLYFGFDQLTFQLYPNPAKTEVKVHVNDAATFSYQLLDMAGRKLQQGYINGNESRINVSQLTAGSYILRLTTTEKTVSTILNIQ